MHPKKAEMLKQLDETSRVHDAALRRSFHVVSHPSEHGWTKSLLTAAVVVPLTGISAVVNDVSRFLLSHSDDDAWGRVLPPGASGEEGGTSERRDSGDDV
jgi:hypothetical protein